MTNQIQKTKELTDKIVETTIDFLRQNATNQEYSLCEVFDMVLSAHLSSLWTCVDTVTKQAPQMNQIANEFSDRLSTYVGTIHPAGPHAPKVSCEEVGH